MDYFNYRDQSLYAEDVDVASIANRYGTPCYVYSRATLERHWHAFDKILSPLPHKIHYAVKANSNLAILNLLVRLGSSFDIVSIGEFERALAAGASPSSMVFSGIGKRTDELNRVIHAGIGCINIESKDELERVIQISKKNNQEVNIAFRVNPDIDPKTHPYISTGLKDNKFGIAPDQALELYKLAADIETLNTVGIAFHIGSQILELSPFAEALDKTLALLDTLSSYGIHLKHINIGGGLGVQYTDESPPQLSDYGDIIVSRLKGRTIDVHIEPGRAIAANAGILLTRVQYFKSTENKQFAIVDAAMNDLLRPALYHAKHQIIPVKQSAPTLAQTSYEVVGPICESSDCFGLLETTQLQHQDCLAIRAAGAYGFSMSSQYNSRPRPPEVMVDKDTCYLIRKNETVLELFKDEYLLP